MAVATIDQQPPARKGPSVIVQAAVLIAMTGLAIGGGWFAGGYMRGQQAGDVAAPAAASGHGAGAAEGHGEAAGSGGEGHLTIIPLAPITTNLAQPSNTWVRMEVSLVFDQAPSDPGLADTVHQDLLTYVRTLKLHQIEGASGFLHLRADLEERAKMRSADAVQRILIRTLLLE